MSEELVKQIRVVMVARSNQQEVATTLSKAKTEWEEKNGSLLELAKFSKETVDIEEGKLRQLTLQAYVETGNKAPAVGVGIREQVVLSYDGKVALNYAKEHLLFLQLNKTAFEKFAKDEKPDFVTITTEPQATIAQNLEVE